MTAKPMGIPAVVLAGGRARPEVVAATGISNRALLSVAGTTMLDRVVTALAGSGLVQDIIVVGEVPASPAYRLVPDSGSLVGNVTAGVEAAPQASHVLIAAADIPFLTPAAVTDTLARGQALGADLVYPIVQVRLCVERFPGMRRTSVRLKEGRFTGGNLFIVRPEFLRSSRGRLAEAYAARKSPARLAGMLGFGVVLRLLAAQVGWPAALSVGDLEAAVTRLLGGTSRGLVSPFPEVAADVDRVEDLAKLGSGDQVGTAPQGGSGPSA